MDNSLYDRHFIAYQGIFNRELVRLGFSQLLIYSGDFKLRFMQDLVYPFQASPWFSILVPVTYAPKSWIVWRVGEKPLLLLYQPEDDFWHDMPETPDSSWAKHFDIQLLQSPATAKTYFGDVQATAFLGEEQHIDINWDITHMGALLAPQDISDWTLGERNPQALISALDWYRAYKTPYEQFCIREANRISVQGHQTAAEAFYQGGSELEIALAFQQGCQLNLDDLAYPSIVCLNERAAILHNNTYSKKRPSEGETHSLLIDAGAAYRGYTSDITRTYAYREGIYGELLIAFDEMQQAIANNIYPGKSFAEFGVSALRQLCQLLQDFNIFMVEPESAMETGIVHQFMPHSLGHPLGAQVHDVGWNLSDSNGNIIERHPQFPQHRTTRIVENGQVYTVEPGLYFIDGLLRPLREGEYRHCINWELVDTLRPYGGIRIEDDVLITDKGVENLTRQAFKEVMV